MNRNIEIKAKLLNRERTEAIVRTLADAGPTLLRQEDVFFTCFTGRLKLRTINDVQSELIYYERADDADPKPSNYRVVPVVDAAGLRAVLNMIAPERGIVRKVRTLYLIGQTRVHLDVVDGLGDYLELEVVLAPDEPIDHGSATASRIIQQLQITKVDLIRGAYLDLLTADTSTAY